ncbi:MAG: SH3 domain-containing protein [Acidobacteriota bacterium]
MKIPCSKSLKPSRAAAAALLALLASLLSCSKEPDGPVYRVIGEAYAGPHQLPLRQDVSLRSPVIATAAHGEKLEILDRRRRFLQVRTKSQQVGWVDIRLLISAKQRDQLDALAQRYKDAPSMGQATVFDVLNVHTDPNRFSPTFLQIQENEKFVLIGHRVAPREPFHGESIEIEDTTPKPPSRRKRNRKEPAVPPPPSPAAPRPPENWLDLSRSPLADSEPGATPAVPMDDLSLIRTKDGRVGWVLTNAIFLEVPDDVAQYAEGQRITSYFPMGEVNDRGEIRKHYLWTTQSQKYAPFEFDGIRLFTWSTRRHRYETALRQRNLRGFFPLNVKPPFFAFIAEDASGNLTLRSYFFDGTRPKLIRTEPYQPPANTPPVSNRSQPLPETDMSWLDRLKQLLPGRD